MTWLTYAKWGGIAAGIIAFAALWFHLGGLSSHATLIAAQRDSALSALKATQDELTEQATESTRRQGVIDEYDRTKDVPDSVGVNVSRMLVQSIGECAGVPEAGSLAGGSAPAAQGAGQAEGARGSLERVRASLGRVREATDAYVQACVADDKQLAAVIKLGPTH